TEDGVTRWDLTITSGTSHIEVKRNANRNDVLEWLDRIRCAGLSDATLELVYATATTPLVRSVEALVRIAKEAGKDPSRFQQLCRVESIKDGDIILQHLGSKAQLLLERLKLQQLPEPILATQIRFMARFLAPSAPERLIQALERKFFA